MGQENSSKRRHILIIEDHQPTRESLTKLLEGSGHSVVQAANGQEGLTELERRSLDLILLDLFMPVLSGWDFLRAIQAMGPGASVPIIVMSSAFATDTDLSLAGVAAVVSKPCRPGELLAKIDACIATK